MANQRIYSLAKELGIATKELLDVCAKLGIHGKDSSLASVDENEIQRIQQYLTKELPVSLDVLTRRLKVDAKEVVKVCEQLGMHGKGDSRATFDSVEIRMITESLDEAVFSAELDEIISSAAIDEDDLLDAEFGVPDSLSDSINKQTSLKEFESGAESEIRGASRAQCEKEQLRQEAPATSAKTEQVSKGTETTRKAGGNRTKPSVTESDTARFQLYEAYRSREYEKNQEGRWSTRRYVTKEGWVLGAWTWRIANDRDHAEIGLFLCEDHQMYVTGSALNWSLRCIFTQAYYQVGVMEVWFVGRATNPTLASGFEPAIPAKIREYATQLGVPLANKSQISHEEAREIYLRITGFSKQLEAAFHAKGIDAIWPCVLVQRDIWSEHQIEYIFKHAPNPKRIFQGGVSPVFRTTYLQDLLVLRYVFMAERLKSLLETTALSGRVELDLKWISSTAVEFVSQSDFSFTDYAGRQVQVSAGQAMQVLILPRNRQEYRMFAEIDSATSKLVHVVCVTRDYRSAGLPAIIEGRPVVVLFDTLDDIDQALGERLGQTINSNAELAERHE